MDTMLGIGMGRWILIFDWGQKIISSRVISFGRMKREGLFPRIIIIIGRGARYFVFVIDFVRVKSFSIQRMKGEGRRVEGSGILIFDKHNKK